MGDDQSWSDPSFRDSDWRIIQAGRSWEDQGFPDYDGYAWYRVHITIPTSVQTHPGFVLHQALRIELGKIDDVDEVWFNGKAIGRTGGFPEAYEPAWLTLRTYLIPADSIRWDEDNVVAIRVYDGAGEGGLYEGPYKLAIADWSDSIHMRFDIGQGNGIYVSPEPAPVEILLSNGTRSALSGQLHWTLETDEGDPLSSRVAEISLPPQAERAFHFDFLPPDPGFYSIRCAFRSKTNSVTKSTAIVLGYRPEAIASPLTREADFDDFWQTTLAQLAAVDPQFQLTRTPSGDSETHDAYEVTLRSLDGVQVGGWYEMPKAPGVHPAVLRVPGYGEAMQLTGRGAPLAILSFNVRGHGNSQGDVPGTPQDFWTRGLEDKNGYFYQGAYADCIRAVDFLVSRPEVDAARIGITGGSQGGGLSLATAALDPRIRLCAPDIPFLCDWEKYFRISNWPEVDAWLAADAGRSLEEAVRTMSYFDALNMADRIQCPIFLGLGLQDDVCPPATIFAVYNRLPGPKEYRVYPRAQHWVGPTHDSERFKWILSHFSKTDTR
jgi:cephalosporin-C deacetylase-like acetyl esterase